MTGEKGTGAPSSKPPKPSKVRNDARSVDPEEEMDRLLEKISRKGIGSLSDEERASLEQARQAILLRSGGSSE